MLRIVARSAAAVVGMICIGLLVLYSLELHLRGGASFEHVVEQTGASILCGVILGLALPMTTRRRLLAAAVAIAGVLAIGHALVLESDAQVGSILVDWLATCLGLLVVVGLLRSWNAMYGKHLVAWGEPSNDPSGGGSSGGGPE